jgi:hypothetical protein
LKDENLMDLPRQGWEQHMRNLGGPIGDQALQNSYRTKYVGINLATSGD